MRSTFAALLGSLVILSSSSASADTILIAEMTNAKENPPAVPTTSTGTQRPASFGAALFTLNDDMTALSFTASIFNIDVTGTQTADTFDNLTAAHIHASATVTPTTNAGVVWGFFGLPFNDINPTDTMLFPFSSAVGGIFTSKWDLTEGNNTTLLAQLPNILSGRSYINFHTVQFGGGEIRGELAPVPEPSTMILVGLGGLGIVRAARRRARQVKADS